jgi:hypothetical protein
MHVKKLSFMRTTVFNVGKQNEDDHKTWRDKQDTDIKINNSRLYSTHGQEERRR